MLDEFDAAVRIAGDDGPLGDLRVEGPDASATRARRIDSIGDSPIVVQEWDRLALGCVSAL